jgi:DNA-binding phage protein
MKPTTPNARSVSHEQKVLERLRNDPAFASEYLEAAIKESENVEELSIALRRFIQARRGIQRQNRSKFS